MNLPVNIVLYVFANVEGPSSLTVEALARHEADQSESNVAFPDIESLSIGTTSAAKSSYTWASQMTDCTNVTFSRVLQRFTTSNLAQHKEVCGCSFFFAKCFSEIFIILPEMYDFLFHSVCLVIALDMVCTVLTFHFQWSV